MLYIGIHDEVISAIRRGIVVILTDMLHISFIAFATDSWNSFCERAYGF